MYQVILSEKHKKIGVPAIDGVKGLFSDAPTLEVGDTLHCVVDHDETNTFLLRKMGFDVPSPILFHYDWAGAPPAGQLGHPFDVQKKTCAMLTMANRAYVLNGMGTGKTKCILWAWDYLYKMKRCGKMIVLAPLSTLTFTWAREIFSTLPGVKCAVVHGSKKKREEILAANDVDIYIINHDGIKVVEDAIKAHPEINVMAIDELAVFRNGGSDRTKIAKGIAAKMEWVWGASGGPIPNSPTDVWGQAQIVTPDRVPRYFRHFQQELMIKLDNFIWKPKDDAVERAFAVMQPAVRFTLDDVAELPEVIERDVNVDMGTLQMKAYKDLVSHCQSMIGTDQVTAANAGAVMMKLLQVSMGWVYVRDQQGVQRTVPLDNANRLQALLDGVTSTDRKCLVFVPFKHALEGISEHFNKKGINIEHAVVSGDTPSGVRSEVFNLFQNTGKYRVLLAHPQCLAHGLTLTAADTVIWFAPTTSLEIYDQANARIRRVGQKHKQQIIHLQSTPVERKIYRILRQHQAVQNKFLDMFEELGGDQW